jgi:alkylation response protein AidB-like acyl-CoA dehydrogenase
VTMTTTREDAQALRSARRSYFDRRSPVAEVRRLMDTPSGHDRGAWQHMADQVAVQGMHIPEEYGGQGFSFVELCIAAEEMGRALVCAPFFASICLAASAIMNAGSEKQKQRLLPEIASGHHTATLAVTEPSRSWDITGIETTARADDTQFLLTGEKTFVIDGATADLIIVAAREPGSVGPSGISLFTLDSGTVGMSSTELFTMDQTRKLAHLSFTDAPATLLGQEGDGFFTLSKTLHQAAVCLAAEQLGGADRALQMAVEYAKTRIQFGRTIGSFQALKHRLVDLLLQVEYARSAVQHAAKVAARGDAELPAASALAQSCCSTTYLHVAADNIQIHGGIGFTWEHDAHLHLKRAKSSEILLGDAAHHRNQLGHHIGVWDEVRGVLGRPGTNNTTRTAITAARFDSGKEPA